MARNKWKINFKPIYMLMMNLENNIEQAAEDAAKIAGEIVHENFEAFFSEGAKSKYTGHYQTGLAKEALKEDFKSLHGKIMYKVGFDYTKPHGLVVIFFEKGSPTIQPKIRIISKAKNDKRIVPAMKEIFEQYLEESKK